MPPGSRDQGALRAERERDARQRAEVIRVRALDGDVAKRVDLDEDAAAGRLVEAREPRRVPGARALRQQGQAATRSPSWNDRPPR
jgi:hypothetical protein